MSSRGPRLSPLLEPSWGPLGPSWRPLEPFWGPPGPSWGRLGGLLGHLGAILGASRAVLERREAENARTPNTFKILRKSCDFCLSGPSWEASWRLLGASWRPLGPSWGHLGRLGAMFRCLDAVLGRLGGFLGLSWPVLGPSGLWTVHASTPGSAQERAGAPRKFGILGPQPLEY